MTLTAGASTRRLKLTRYGFIPAGPAGMEHKLDYHGNYIPQIATQLLTRYSKKDEIVLDLFLGSGTTAIEAARLDRRCIGVELKPELVDYVRGKIKPELLDERIHVLQGDSAAPETVNRVAHFSTDYASQLRSSAYSASPLRRYY